MNGLPTAPGRRTMDSMDTHAPARSVPGLDHPHLWLWRSDGRFTCQLCTAEEPAGFAPCQHAAGWLPLDNALISCMVCLIVAEGPEPPPSRAPAP